MSSARRSLALLPAAIVLSFPAACAARRPPPAPAEAPGPAGALRAFVKGRMEFAGETLRFEAMLALKAPDRLYVEIGGPVGGRRAILAARGRRLAVLFPPERQFLEEEASPSTYESLLGLRLDTAGLVDLLGSAGVEGSRRLASWTDGDGVPVILMVTREAGRMRIEAREPRDGGFRSLELRLLEVERPDPSSLPEDLFSVTAPEGWRRLRLPSRRAPVLFP